MLSYLWFCIQGGDSKNILGILLRGTDYKARKPKGHSKPPSLKRAINDTINMDNKYFLQVVYINI